MGKTIQVGEKVIEKLQGGLIFGFDVETVDDHCRVRISAVTPGKEELTVVVHPCGEFEMPLICWKDFLGQMKDQGMVEALAPTQKENQPDDKSS